ncbi:hypothetical protein NLJ89_g558 [Agrocybe chaxingu]|uniref:Uncharacterized protein n=1 Tax=Agrocybe chaxingu TaxID=84603 RepID=A0A9W8N1P1_9AGAR|nr:hypothetical protein NLJ89_g558 [Agrocybe chaxingu]
MNKAFRLKRRAASHHPQSELRMATTSTDSPPRLPQELLDIIVDELGSNAERHEPVSRSTLTSCALVSKSMSARARGHLFSTISLRWKPYTSTVDARRTRICTLKCIMEADAQFVSFVRTLELSLDNDAWGTDDLPGVLTMLYSTPRSGLRALRLTAQSSVVPRSWGLDAKVAGKKALANLCLSGCLTELVIHGPMQESVLLLSKIPKGLVSLELSNASLIPTAAQLGMGLRMGDGEGVRLEKLVVDEVSAIMLFVDWKVEPSVRTRILAMMQGLKTLELETKRVSEDGRYFAVVLEQCRRSLERLVWSVEPFEDRISALLSHVPLSSFTALRSLTFKIWTKGGLVPNVNTRRLFSAIRESAMPSLEHLTFAIRLRPTWQSRRVTIDDLTDHTMCWGWEMLDVALGSKVRYPCLVLVEIDLGIVGLDIGGVFVTEEAYAQEEARVRLKALFPSFLASGGDLKTSFEGVFFCNKRT